MDAGRAVTGHTTRIAFNSARFLTSAARLDQCPEDTGREVAFAGRSNSGKSSAINAITRIGSLARTSKTPGRTQLINFFSLSTPGTRLVDLPGYGFARVSRNTQKQWEKHLGDYLAHRQSLVSMTLIMDLRHPLSEFDAMLIEWCEHHGLPMMLLLTKADKLKSNPARRQIESVRRDLEGIECIHHIQPFSALKGQGVEPARNHLSDWLLGVEPASD
ncbi:YihA family ribosome biogenesis GTP-binding protein [Halomonas sp. 22501_18_FS]|mgnify:FL=1|uniref:Probable GTP-binding protein EngB n=1 Tax=Vreelandella halophila TaxID=86177 RepID=A0A9X4YDH5_9GAMM|nr:YihA family ribosome biogenesis GTP-binding protein [Halospina sp. K52047b]MYL27165.1 YihA family ribosome biogenesis GTP-binding protein [Halomonas utahensis]MYL74367.1 YihA family ribosome biogenesis GTP-binding protein [Halomonas sp. 22501_18_FS]